MAGFEPTGTTTSHPVFDVLGYAWGQCTAFVAESVGWLGGGAGLGNAANWLNNAKSQGYGISSTPVPGSVAVFGAGTPGSGGAGHVALVTAVNGAGFNVAEANVQGLDVVSAGSYADSNPNLLGFILPKGGATPPIPANLTAFGIPPPPAYNPAYGGNPNAGSNALQPAGGIDLNPADWAGGHRGRDRRHRASPGDRHPRGDAYHQGVAGHR